MNEAAAEPLPQTRSDARLARAACSEGTAPYVERDSRFGATGERRMQGEGT